MGSLSHNLKLAGLLLNITEWDRHLEVVRQILNGIEAFEPYEAFLRIHKGGKTGFSGGFSGITSREIENFMRDNSLPVDLNALEVVIKIYDTKFNGFLDFEDFLKMTLTRDNPSVRFDAAANRQIRDLQDDDRLAEEVEYCLARLFSKAIDFVRRMKIDAESQSILAEKDLFNKLLSASGSTGSNLDFKVLKRFFEQLKIVPKDSEIIAILRIIDINDDGVIDKAEFDYFLGLFNLQGPDVSLLYRLKDRNKKEHEYNYFGEKKGGLNQTGNLTSGQGMDRLGTSARSFQSTQQTLNLRTNNSSEKSPVYRIPASDLKPGLSSHTAQYRNNELISTAKEYKNLSPTGGLNVTGETRLKGVVPNSNNSKTYQYERTTYSEMNNDLTNNQSKMGNSRPNRSPNKVTFPDVVPRGPDHKNAESKDVQNSRYLREVAELRMLGSSTPSAAKEYDHHRISRTLVDRNERSTPKRALSPPRSGTPSQQRRLPSLGKENSATPSKRQRTEYTRLTSTQKADLADNRNLTGPVQPSSYSRYTTANRDRDSQIRGGDSLSKIPAIGGHSSVDHRADRGGDSVGPSSANLPISQKPSSPSFRAYDPSNNNLHSVETIRTTSLYKEVKLS